MLEHAPKQPSSLGFERVRCTAEVAHLLDNLMYIHDFAQTSHFPGKIARFGVYFPINNAREHPQTLEAAAGIAVAGLNPYTIRFLINSTTYGNSSSMTPPIRTDLILHHYGIPELVFALSAFCNDLGIADADPLFSDTPDAFDQGPTYKTQESYGALLHALTTAHPQESPNPLIGALTRASSCDRRSHKIASRLIMASPEQLLVALHPSE